MRFWVWCGACGKGAQQAEHTLTGWVAQHFRETKHFGVYAVEILT